MRRIVLVMVVVCANVSVQAQSWQEWFDQKKTQIEYLVDQIGALEVYTGSLEKGYDIAHSGLTAIHAIKKGDFSLHSEYFTSLSRVSPQIKGYCKIADIVQTEIRIVRASSRGTRLMNEAGLFTSGEIRYCSSVFNGLLDGCQNLIDQLIDLTTDGKLQMEDDQRLARIDEVYSEMKDREKFVFSFSQEIKTLALQKAEEQHEGKVLQRMYGIQ